MKGWGLPGEAKKSQRNLGLLVASGDLILFANSIAKKKKVYMGGRTGGTGNGREAEG